MNKFLGWISILLFFFSLPIPAARHSSRHATSREPSSADSVTMERLLTLEDHRLHGDKFLIAALRNPSPKVVRTALLALGRIGDTSAVEEISRFFNRKERELKKLAAFSLSLIGDDTAMKVMTQNLLMQKDPEMQAALLVGIARAGNEQTVKLMNTRLNEETNPLLLEAASHGLALLWSGKSESWAVPPGLLTRLAELAHAPEPVATSAAFALARYKGDASAIPASDVLDSVAKAHSDSARAFLFRTLGRVKSAQAALTLTESFVPTQSLGVRAEIARSLGMQMPSPVVLAGMKKELSDPSSTVVTQCMESASNYGPAAGNLADAIDTIYKTWTSPWVRGVALKALARIDPTIARERINAVLNQPESPIFPAAVGALGILANQEDLLRLSELASHPDPRAAEEALETFGTVSEDRITPPMKAGLRKALEKGDPAVSALVAQLIERLKWKEFVPTLTSVYRLFVSPDQLEGKVAVLDALAVVGDHTSVELLESALAEPDRPVAAAAANALKTITGKDMSARVPLNSKVNAPIVNYSEAMSATRSQVVLKTSRGEIRLKMLDIAPTTAMNFVRLVKKGFYDGKTFHRVAPNFVVQGGDPRGDGYGGPGYFIRDEVSPLVHERGTVGMATSGKDTGGSQFFFNLAPNLHLDGKYTLFAKVTSGIDVVDKLEIGDQIISARVIP